MGPVSSGRKARLKVCIVGLNYTPEPTGIAPYTAGLARGLSKRGHSVRVVTGYPHYPEWRVRPGYRGLRKTEDCDGVPVSRRRHFVPRRSTAIGRTVLELSFGMQAILSRWGRPDVVICVSPGLVSTGLVVARASLSPGQSPAIGIWVQDLYSSGVVETNAVGSVGARFVLALESKVLRSADGVSVIHDRFKQVLVESLRVRGDLINVTRNWTHVGSSELTKSNCRSLFGWRDDEFIALHAGNMGAKQGLENVISAARLAVGRGLRVRFVLVGDGNQRAHLEVLAAGLDSVEFVPPLADDMYLAALRGADVLLVNERPGVKEMALPSKLTSYFMSGNPVVAATEPSGITAQELQSAGAGAVVPAGQPGSLLDAVVDLASNPARAKACGHSGKLFVHLKLSEDLAINELEAWISSLSRIRAGF
ncbi:glycosyltransferase family 4 protein [Rhodococcus opacus]|uniref:Glycosyltransferase family 4 protein n=2 Tax=Rhodococcus opacus TaxID=37919 RepID=A0AAX3YNU3_RHOOP|nr:glycosyltransferase family 4 protein [Rhodococcus opacus]MCZ4587519.1 glycosyltransferase family 4 protein [Rhodococcus opacus]WLF50908.1 glycosyltransferase family 4 protein [Rhodococcus opacus]